MAQPDLKLRPAAQVMRLSRMGSFHQSRLSFMRIILRRFERDNWRFERREFEINAKGVGHAVYTAHGPQRSYSLVAFAHDLPDDQRSDRVIAEAWDSTFALFDGIPTREDIARLSQNVPLQEAGRVSERELSLSRANRSGRMWAHVVDRLAAGRQPDIEKVWAVGYLMRTTAVYGSGKFGAADRETIADRPEFAAPFQVEMLSVYLTRTYVRDLVEHMAQTKSPETAVRMEPWIARSFGIGNATGLGMAPFLLTHPRLINNWIAARETALARVRAVETASDGEAALFRELMQRSALSVSYWRSAHPIQVEKLADLNADLPQIKSYLADDDLTGKRPWNRLFEWAEETLSVEGQELIASLMLEPYGPLVDDMADHMSADEASAFRIDGSMTIATLSRQINAIYGWALDIDWQDRAAQARAWYVSEEKLEPRLGERFDEPIADYEQPLSPGRDTARVARTLQDWAATATVAELLLRHPEHRHIVRRIQAMDGAPYAEIRDNTISATVLPIDMLRCKLSFFGAVHFDPRSDRWVRICMYNSAPYPEEIGTQDADFWVYPPLEAGGGMSFSLNETEALCRKAARGAGYGWGLSEEAGKAVRWMVRFGLPGPALLARHLSRIDGKTIAAFAPVAGGGVWTAAAGELCPITAGAALCDFSAQIGHDGIALHNLLCPALLLPFTCAAAAAQNVSIAVEWEGTRYVTDAKGITCTQGSENSTDAGAAQLRCSVISDPGRTAGPIVTRATIDAGTLKTLNTLAHRTYAPATDASRLAGAGE